MERTEAIQALETADQAEQEGQPIPPLTDSPTGDSQTGNEEPGSQPSTEPITQEAVAGDKSQPSAPDSTMLRDQLQALAAPPSEPETDPRDDRIAQLEETVQRLVAGKVADPVGFLQQYTGLTPEQLITQQHTPDNVAQQAAESAQKAQETVEQLRAQMAEQEQQRHLEELRGGVKTFVQSKATEYPILNGTSNQDLVFQLMLESLNSDNPLSEAEAAVKAETKLNEFFEAVAAIKGSASQDSSQAVGTSEATPSLTINPQSVTSTTATSWDELTDDERRQEAIKLL